MLLWTSFDDNCLNYRLNQYIYCFQLHPTPQVANSCEDVEGLVGSPIVQLHHVKCVDKPERVDLDVLNLSPSDTTLR